MKDPIVIPIVLSYQRGYLVKKYSSTPTTPIFELSLHSDLSYKPVKFSDCILYSCEAILSILSVVVPATNDSMSPEINFSMMTHTFTHMDSKVKTSPTFMYFSFNTMAQK